MIYDYIIAGSGPAGTIAAYCLKKQGKTCLLLEAESCKREKVCGGLVTWSAIKLLEKIGISVEPLLSEGVKKIDTFTIFREGKEIVHKYHCGEYGIGTSRQLFDMWLLKRTLELGTEIRYKSRVKEILVNGKELEICGCLSKQLIVATGARGYKTSDMHSLIKRQSMGISAQIRGNTILKDNSVYFWYINQSYDYFWAIPIGEKLWNIGIWFQKPNPEIGKKFYEFQKLFINPVFKNYEYKYYPRGAFCGNVDLSGKLPLNCTGIGDFSGCNNPYSGEGIRYAIESAINLVGYELTKS